MITPKNILDMYVHLRTTNNSIPDEVLDFMKETCLARLSEDTKTYVCTDFELEFNNMCLETKKISQEPTAEIFTIQVSRR